MAASEAIAKKIAELAQLLNEEEREAPGRAAKALRESLRSSPPASQALLYQAFGSDIRRELLRAFLSGGKEEEMSSLETEGRVSNEELAALVARLFRQFLSIESAVVAIATELTHEAQRLRLPRHVANLRGYVLQLIRFGGADAVDKVNEYLGDINRWIAASLKAWEQAPEKWWTEWWRKINPQAIEESVAIGVVGSLLGNKFHQYWKQYREFAKDLNPPDAKSLILEIAARIAKEEMKL